MKPLSQIVTVIQDKVELVEALEDILPYAPTTQDIIDNEIDQLGGLIRDILESNE